MPAGLTYEPIATNTVSGASTSTVTFDSISGSYTDLIAISNWSNSNGAADTYMRINNDTGNNYSLTRILGYAGSAISNRFSNTNLIYLNYDVSTAQRYGITQFQNYSNTTTYKSLLHRGNSASLDVAAFVALWRSTNAITRVDFITNTGVFNAGSTFTLYGITKA